MAAKKFYLRASSPADFNLRCVKCGEPTDETLGLDVSERPSAAMIAAELVVHELAILTHKSVRVPLCRHCRDRLRAVRRGCALGGITCIGAFCLPFFVEGMTGLHGRHVYAGGFLMLSAVLTLLFLPFLYTLLKEHAIGVHVYGAKERLIYEFSSPAVLEVLERDGYCTPDPTRSSVWDVVTEESE